MRTDFDCEKDAEEALLRWSKKLKYHCLDEMTLGSKKMHTGKCRPKPDTPVTYCYRPQTAFKEDLAIDFILKTKGLIHHCNQRVR